MKMAEEYGKGVPMVLNPQMGAIDGTVESIRYRAQLIARNQKLDSGVMSTGFIGFAAGFLFSLLMVVVLPLMAGL
ncbi:tetrahydromethanopterin S-methyltransferase subunit F [Methanosarcina horonobensis]|nr:tetrahydromethanopterin S-methyltransferase subunit F [Methanosarcina horonobensis]